MKLKSLLLGFLAGAILGFLGRQWLAYDLSITADWLAAIGTLAAFGISVYIYWQSNREKIKVFLSKVDGQAKGSTELQVLVLNAGNKPVKAYYLGAVDSENKDNKALENKNTPNVGVIQKIDPGDAVEVKRINEEYKNESLSIFKSEKICLMVKSLATGKVYYSEKIDGDLNEVCTKQVQS
ncbi:hypothetical protein ACM640_10765 [Lactiplantibacillus plantarum]|uniref:hypothetical protein n=1 Tax=Lactiplantibacillus plantarum TaxID=1590 RepID=UPI003AFFE14D